MHHLTKKTLLILVVLCLPGAWTFGLIRIATAHAATPSVCESEVKTGEGCHLLGEIGKGTIVNEGGIAVNQNTGDIYVADLEGQRILEYTPTGELILMFGKAVNQTKDNEPGASEEEQDICTTASHDTCTTGQAGNGNGQFSSPSGVAIDQGTGDLYIGDTGNDRVQKLTSEGHYISQIDSDTNNTPTFYLPTFSSNIAVDSHGNLLILDLEENGDAAGKGHALQFNPAGEYTGHNYGPLLLATEKLKELKGIAVDEDGYVYISRENRSVVQFSPEGQALATFTASTGGRAGVDPETGEVFVATPEGRPEVVEYTRSGQRLESFGPVAAPVRGLAYDVSEGVLYVSDRGTGSVLVFGPFPTPAKRAPVVQRESLASLTQSATTLTAEVSPGGEPATYWFEYGTSPSLGGAQRTPSVSAGDGFGIVQASAPISVQPNTQYFYRVVVHSSFDSGSTTDGAVQSFASPAVPPTATTGSTSSVTQDTATLTGTVTPGSSGPSSLTEWCFEYGTDAAYNHGSLPIPALSAGEGDSPVPVSLQLAGLYPDTLYHYRLVAVNSLSLGSFGLGTPACGTAGGVVSDGPDQVFSTAVPAAPAVVTGGVVSLSANAAVISGVVDAHGEQSSYEFDVGTDTSYGAQIFGNAKAGVEPEAFSVALGSLQPGTTYHYRLVASNARGTTYGADQAFTTPTIPGSVISAPPAAPLIATQPVAFPTEAEPVTAKTVKTKKPAKKKFKSRKKRSRVHKVNHRGSGHSRSRR